MNVVIFGASEFAEVACAYLRKHPDYDVRAFTVAREYLTQDALCGFPVVPFEDLPDRYPPDEFGLFIAVGFSALNENRRAIYERAKALGYRMPTYIHPTVERWEETSIGEACFIFENNVIQPYVSIGNNCVIWSGNHIGHHSMIGDHVFIASHAVISGKCHVGDGCFIGVNATLRDGVAVGEHSLVGAGALVLADAPPRSFFKGAATVPTEYRPRSASST